jgi:monoamine oxidase
MFNIGIVGGGMAGLYAGMICIDLGLDFNILEASGRPGGRVWTHRFSDAPGDYYDVGAMRFPDTAIMKRTFDLFDKLGFEKDESQNPKQGNLIPYHFSGPNNPFYYNNILVEDGKVAGDEFKMSVGAGGIVPG